MKRGHTHVYIFKQFRCRNVRSRYKNVCKHNILPQTVHFIKYKPLHNANVKICFGKMFPLSPKSVQRKLQLLRSIHFGYTIHTCNLPPAKFRIMLLVLLLVQSVHISGKDSSLTYPKIYINNQHQGLCQNKMVVWFCKGCVCMLHICKLRGMSLYRKRTRKRIFFLNAKINI